MDLARSYLKRRYGSVELCVGEGRRRGRRGGEEGEGEEGEGEKRGRKGKERGRRGGGGRGEEGRKGKGDKRGRKGKGMKWVGRREKNINETGHLNKCCILGHMASISICSWSNECHQAWVHMNTSP